MGKFDSKDIKLHSSWQYTDESYKVKIDALRQQNGDFTDDGKYPVLWSTRSKFVLLLTCGDGTQIVYKAPRRLRSPLRYVFRPGPWGNEAVNYQRLADIGLPMVKLISAGEKRCFFILKHGYLMTEYAANFSDGRDFTPEGKLYNDYSARDEFIRRNFQYLAEMHSAGFIHKGFTPANLLYKKSGDTLEIKWIDVASCKKVPFKFNIRKHIARDLSLFFHFFNFTAEEKLSLLTSYCEACEVWKTTPEKLLSLIDRNPVR